MGALSQVYSSGSHVVYRMEVGGILGACLKNCVMRATSHFGNVLQFLFPGRVKRSGGARRE